MKHNNPFSVLLIVLLIILTLGVAALAVSNKPLMVPLVLIGFVVLLVF